MDIQLWDMVVSYSLYHRKFQSRVQGYLLFQSLYNNKTIDIYYEDGYIVFSGLISYSFFRSYIMTTDS
jgi:hypothetical protein